MLGTITGCIKSSPLAVICNLFLFLFDMKPNVVEPNNQQKFIYSYPKFGSILQFLGRKVGREGEKSEYEPFLKWDLVKEKSARRVNIELIVTFLKA